MKLAPFILALALASCQQPLRSAHAQIQPGPNILPGGYRVLWSPRAGYFGPPAAIHSWPPHPFRYRSTGAPSYPILDGPASPPWRAPIVPPPPVIEPPPPALPPSPPAVPLPPPRPLGWVYTRYTSCPEPHTCPVIYVSVGADGLNVRTVPDGPPILALVNGTPLIVLTRQDRWTLVAPACELAPTGLWSITANVPLGGCL